MALLVATTPVEAGSEIHFNSPGAFAGGETSGIGGKWLLLVFHGGDDSSAGFDLPFLSEGLVHNLTWAYPVYVQNQSTQISPYAVPLQSNHTMPVGSTIHLAMRGPSSLYIEAEHIEFHTDGVSGKIAEKSASSSTKGFMRFRDSRDRLQQNQNPPGEHAVLQFEPELGTGFRVHAEGASHIEWHGAETSCQETDWCPDGGPTTVQHFASVRDLNFTSAQFSYQYVADAGPVPTIEGGGRLAYAVLGGPDLGFDIRSGSIRLPLATAVAACPSCSAPQNQTLTVTGNLNLVGLRRTGESALAVRFDGDLATAKLDEVNVDPRELMGVGVGVVASAAVVALGILALKVLGLLFTKWREEDLLDQPRRRLVFEAVASHPGVGFRELTRVTGLAIGTLRHHLDVLLRHGRIVEKDHGNSLRFFENHGKYERTWSRVAVLRDEETRRLHDWLTQHPDTPQNELLLALGEQGLSRTAAQRRLQRLEAAGLVAFQERGRFKVYRAV